MIDIAAIGRSANGSTAAQELVAHGIKVQTINPGACYTGYSGTMADNPFRGLDDARHVVKLADLRRAFDAFLDAPEGRMDARSEPPARRRPPRRPFPKECQGERP
ncbi:hypothetical protein [Xanthobacter sediminis]